jgi:23S rRNA (pseudouridine1915-N3)-methyltransferase
MKIKIITIGKLNNLSPEFILSEEYKKRISYKIEIKEISSKSSKIQEGKKVLKSIDKDNFLICLDENGKEYTSELFAKQIESLSLSNNHITFLIGGAEGHSEEIKNKCHLIISLGRMTWPHKLARIMLLEQIYRAQTILSNHPYHKNGK